MRISVADVINRSDKQTMELHSTGDTIMENYKGIGRLIYSAYRHVGGGKGC